MRELSWEEARDITEAFFLPFKCIVDEKESDFQNVVPFVIYFDYDNSEERYGPYAISGFRNPERLESKLSKIKADFVQTISG